MTRNWNEENLKPYVRTIAVSGGTGDGKSEFTSVFAKPNAKKIISKSVGTTNSTLKERIVVYTEDAADEILVAVKKVDEVFPKQKFIDMITYTLIPGVLANGKKISSSKEKSKSDFIIKLEDQFNTKINTNAVIAFLSEDEKRDFIDKLVTLLEKNGLFDLQYTIYHSSKNGLQQDEIKDNSAKFKAAIYAEIQNTFDNLDQMAKEEIFLVCKKANELLSQVFFKYFDEQDISKDGYHYKCIDLQNPDMDFVNAIFTANDLRKGDNLSLEIFCSEIFIYAPLHESITSMIKADSNMKEILQDKHGKISLGIYDTRGLYHANATNEENYEYFTDLLYEIPYDTLVLVHPLTGDTNEKKLMELYSEALKGFNKQIPVFMLNNKVDIFIDEMNKNLTRDDVFSIETNNDIIEFNEIRKSIDEKLELISEEIMLHQNKNRKNLKIKCLPCYLKKSTVMPEEALKAYNIIESIREILNNLCEHLRKEAFKLKFHLSSINDSNILPIVNDEKIEKIIIRYLQSKETKAKVFDPAIINIQNNLGKTPHGNSYAALRRRLINGEGYTSNINDSYFYNCKSFTISFPGILKNFVSKELQSELLDIIEFDGGRFENDSDKEKLLNIANNYFNEKKVVSEMLYNSALLEAEKVSFGYQKKFNNFLTNCIGYFNEDVLIENEDEYVKALKGELIHAVNKAIELHVLYV